MRTSRRLWIFLLFFIATLIIFLPTLSAFFFADDFDWLYTAHQVGLGQATFLTPVGRARPLFLLLFSLAFSLFHLSPFPYHLLSLFFHAANSALIFLFCQNLHQKKGFPLLFSPLAALLFLIASIHYQPSVWITYLQDELALLFVLLLLLSAIKHKVFFACLAYLASLGFKEHAFLIPLLLPALLKLYHGKVEAKEKLYFILPLLPLLGFLSLFHTLPVSFGLPPSLYDAHPYIGPHLWTTYRQLLKPSLYFLLGFITLPGFYTFSPLSHKLLFFSALIFPLLLLQLFFAKSLFRALGEKRRWTILLLALALLSLFPASTLPYLQLPTGGFFAPFRYLYLADAFLMPLLALWLTSLPKGKGQLLGFGYTTLLLSFSFFSLLVFQQFHTHLGAESKKFAEAIRRCRAEQITFIGFPQAIVLRHRNQLPALAALLWHQRKQQSSVLFSPFPPLHGCSLTFSEWQKL